MPRSAQIYKIISTNHQQFKNALDQISHQITKMPHQNNLIISKTSIISTYITIKYEDNHISITEKLYVEFDFKKHYCYIIGKTKGRDAIINLLNQLLEPDPHILIIQKIQLNGKSIYIDMLKILTNINKKHFIKTLNADFGLNGINSVLDEHNIQKIQYGFIKNICASEHKDAANYVEHAIKCVIKFGVWEIGKFSKSKTDNPMTIGVNTDYAFRLFWDYEFEEILALIKALRINHDAYPNV